MLYLVDRLTRDVGCYFNVLGIYFSHPTERKILRMKFNEKLIEIRKNKDYRRRNWEWNYKYLAKPFLNGRQEFPKQKDIKE